MEVSMTLEQYSRTRWLTPAALACVATLAMPIGYARAGTEIIDSAFGTCTPINCSATSIAGFVASFGNSVTPWTAKFLATTAACLRLDVAFVRTAANLEMVVIAPDGSTSFRADGGGTAGATAPLVKISPAPKTGYYTVVVSSTTGAAVNTDFQLLFGQYDPGNPNCASPTPPL